MPWNSWLATGGATAVLPFTRDRSEAARWFRLQTFGHRGPGSEGSGDTVSAGRRGRIIVENRESRNIVISAMIGSIQQPR